MPSIKIPRVETLSDLKVAVANAITQLESDGFTATAVELPPWAVALIENAPRRELGELRSAVTVQGIAALSAFVGLRIERPDGCSVVRVR